MCNGFLITRFFNIGGLEGSCQNLGKWYKVEFVSLQFVGFAIKITTFVLKKIQDSHL